MPTRSAIATSGALFTSWLLSAPAHAAAGVAQGPRSELSQVLLVLGMVGTAYLLTHFVVDWVQRRLLVSTGFEYLVLGTLLGPAVVAGVEVFDDLTALAPVIAFAAGWVGLLYGMEFDLGTVAASVREPLGIGPSLRLAAVESTTTGGAVAAATYVLLRSPLGEVPPDQAMLCALVLGCTAAAGSSSAVELIRSRYPATGTRGTGAGLLPLLGRTARLEDALSIALFGLVFCLFHEGGTRTPNPPGFSDWLLLTIGIGVALGVLFTTFLGDEASDHDRFLALVGIIIFASGAAFFLDLSALLVNLLLGAILVNTRHGVGVAKTLAGTLGPARLILLVFAGALWVPVAPLPAAALVATCLVVRLLGKAFGCWLAALGTPLRRDLFRGLLAQGEVAMAMAISFRLVYQGPGVDLAYTAILATAAVWELGAPRLLHGLLTDAGELRALPPAPAEEAAGAGTA